MRYEWVREYLRTYSNTPPYDFNGLLHLVLAAVDNFREHHLECDLQDYASVVSDDQAEFLLKLLDYRSRYPDAE